MAMTLATAWVRRGVAAEFPQKYDIDDAELGRLEKLAKLQLDDAREGLDRAQNGEDEDSDADSETGKEEGAVVSNGSEHESNKEDDDLKEYNLSDYDDDEVDEQGEKATMFGNIKSLAYHAPGEDDPYLTLPNGEQDSDDEREDQQILRTDNLILAAKVEDEVANLEVMVYEDSEDNIYVHHDIMLPAIPLCVEWIDVPVGQDAGKRTTGNFAAIGTMSPEIEVWDLDIIDAMVPAAILGQTADEIADTVPEEASSSKKKKSKKKKKPKANDEYHVDAVLALALNKQHRNLLASASADKTVKLWDLTTGKCAKSYTMHTDKVCALDWHPTEATILLSGSYDRTIIATDMRAPDAIAPKWIVEADVEKVRWDIHDPNYFYVTTEAGTIHYFDARTPPPPSSHTSPSKPLWTLQAHDGSVSAFDINTTVPGFLATGSDDKRVKLWNVQNNTPSMVVSRNLEVGRVFSTQFAPDPEVAFRLCVAGSKGQVQVWDTSTNAHVRRIFAGRVKMPEGDVKERFVGVGRDDDDDDESEEGEEDEEDGGAATGNGNGNGDGDGPDGWESMDED